MKIQQLIVLATAFTSAMAASPQDVIVSGTWTDTRGRTIQAEFVCLTDDHITLARDGRQFTVFVGNLSPESRHLAKRFTEQAAAPDLGKRVLAFCVARIGKKVGNGQCATLAVQALAAAGARGMGRDAPNRGDYVWGRQVALIEADRKGVKGLPSITLVKPGDIIQFRDARFDGVSDNGGTYWMSAPHHTAVVASVEPDRATLVVYHQNWGKKVVRQDRMQLADLKKGWLRIYRPVVTR